MPSRNVLVPLVAVLLLGVVVWFFASLMPTQAPQTDVTNFDECAGAGYPVMESYPRQCNANGQHFVEDPPAGGQGPDGTSNDDGLGLQANGCAVAGCSGQLCVSADEAGGIVSTCEYRTEYGCYREASCEPQANGKCGWTQTDELKQCLANPPELDDNLQTI